jgi:hypothetical protein
MVNGKIFDELTRINNVNGTANAQINALSCDNQQLNEKLNSSLSYLCIIHTIYSIHIQFLLRVLLKEKRLIMENHMNIMNKLIDVFDRF